MTQSLLKQGISRGVRQCCPNCGEGRLFRAYLKVETPCSACGHDNLQYPSDDGPAYITILLVGHLLVAPLLVLKFISDWPVGYVLGLTLPLLTIATLALLPFVKGGFIGMQWAIKRGDAVRSPA
jgi:uncharacterized protein (DUF983 family)